MREFLRELAAVAAAALVYYLVRGAVSDRADEAFQRARDILELEQRLRLDWESAIHEAILASNALIDFANGTYFWGHMPLLVVLAVWLWRSHRGVWRTFRNALLISAAVGMVSYYLFPTAPPRLMPELAYVDTLAIRAAPAYQAQEVGLFVNPYAALPSLHVGWALLAGLAVWQTSNHSPNAGVRRVHPAVAELGRRRDRQPLDAGCIRRNRGLRDRLGACQPRS